MSTNDTLSYDVFVSEPIPLNVTGLLPNGERHIFSPLSTTLIYGKNDAVLVDPPLTIDQAKRVGDWVEASGKKLTHIFVTHGHGDHWFTADVLAERFGAHGNPAVTVQGISYRFCSVLHCCDGYEYGRGNAVL